MWLASETVTPEQADHYISVITQIERERIINLIKEHPPRWNSGFSCECGTFVNYWVHIQNLVEGENK
jgi:hypothetical protein